MGSIGGLKIQVLEISELEKTASKRVVLLVTTLSSFLTPFMGSSVNIAIPTIGKHFGMNAVLLGWVATSYILAAAIFLVPLGRIGDIYGRKKIFTLGILLDAVSCLVLACSNSAWLLITFRVFQGIGGAMIFGTGVAILTSVFPVGERGKALGINVATVYLGLSLGPIVGGFLTHHLGWRSIFLANLPMVAVVIVLIFWKMKGEWAEARGEGIDVVGSFLYMAGVVSLMCGVSFLPGRAGMGLILAGIVGLLVFFKWEAKAPSPVLNVNLFRRNMVFTFSNLAALINYSATFAVGFLLSLYLQYIKHLSPEGAGAILLSQPVIQAIFSPFAGRLSDRVDPRLVTSAGMVFTVAGLLMLSFLGEGTSRVYIVASMMILGFSFALFSSPNTNAIMSSVEKKFYGVAAATMGTMRLMGQMLSMGIAMLIFSLILGRVQITPENHPQFLTSMKTAFVVFSIFCFWGIFASLARGKVKAIQPVQ
jgi:EmrB/QacA subfamily drug resistance transporter